MNRIVLAFVLLTLSFTAWACPGCAGSDMGKDKTPWTLIILSTFIVCTYVPFYMLYRATKKYDPKNLNEHN